MLNDEGQDNCARKDRRERSRSGTGGLVRPAVEVAVLLRQLGAIGEAEDAPPGVHLDELGA